MIILIGIFLVYNVVVYTQGTSNNIPKMSKKALLGEKLYQDNNCTACHQIFGLGGYLGPDLTNIISNKNKGKDYMKVFLTSATKTMPQFEFTEDEKEALVSFFTELDQCGHYPILNSQKSSIAWVNAQ